jgi:hypothetical protein
MLRWIAEDALSDALLETERRSPERDRRPEGGGVMKAACRRATPTDPQARDPQYSRVASAIGRARALAVLAETVYFGDEVGSAFSFASDVSDADRKDIMGWLGAVALHGLADELSDAAEAYRAECAAEKATA